MRSRTPADAKAALEDRDRAMRNEGIRKAANIPDEVWRKGGVTEDSCYEIQTKILNLIEKEPEGKGDE